MMDFFSDYTMTINGAAVSTAKTMDVINPASAKPFAAAPIAGAAELDAAVEAATQAQPAWAGLGIEKRRELLCAVATAVEKNADELSHHRFRASQACTAVATSPSSQYRTTVYRSRRDGCNRLGPLIRYPMRSVVSSSANPMSLPTGLYQKQLSHGVSMMKAVRII